VLLGRVRNVLFEGGDPKGALTERPLCGFFAATRERMAAGCTPEVNEAEYHDFTSYFFAALSGRDRTGKAVPAPDYDKDGSVGMHEAFAYATSTSPLLTCRSPRVMSSCGASSPCQTIRSPRPRSPRFFHSPHRRNARRWKAFPGRSVRAARTA
jgi:hypothetical protein